MMSAQLIDTVALIYLQDGKLLCSLTKGRGAWYLPGGKREKGESDEQTLIREIKEELDVDIDPATMRLYGVFEAQAHNEPEGVTVRMTCYSAKISGEIKASGEIESVKYLGFSDKSKTPPVGDLIFDDLYARKLVK